MFVYLSVFVPVSNIIQKVMNGIVMKFYGEVRGGNKKSILISFGGSLNQHVDWPIENPAITQRIISRFWWDFQDNSAKINGTID